ncbi:hypothetical protein NEOLEDRAFT_1166973 [Neolentinus lepideus HHB14362 ss-1]|uniref:Uncharacterized protein n=1 Tax=Neolentinus lepideus HHB14362 ss-1 TaxID=1314782 RepID=A0A165VDN9_9AGAM|nr:hypothetical protein NEOLEDRAFT_1166973 [Neolentinus lepideus HHB14362 ss-1]
MASSTYTRTHIPEIGVTATASSDVNEVLSAEWNELVWSQADHSRPDRIDFYNEVEARLGFLLKDATQLADVEPRLRGANENPFSPREGPSIVLRIQWPGLNVVDLVTLSTQLSKAELLAAVGERLCRFIVKHGASRNDNPRWTMMQRVNWRALIRVVALIRTTGGVFEAEIQRHHGSK